MNSKDDQNQDQGESDLQREIRAGRKFTLSEAIGRMAGSDLMKGASPVTLKRQAELEMKHYLDRNLSDVEGALAVVLLRRVTEGRILVDMGYEQPLVAMGQTVDRLLASENYMKGFVREIDLEWGRANIERPHFERDGHDPHPDDPYTFDSVSAKLSALRQTLQGR